MLSLPQWFKLDCKFVILGRAKMYCYIGSYRGSTLILITHVVMIVRSKVFVSFFPTKDIDEGHCIHFFAVFYSYM